MKKRELYRGKKPYSYIAFSPADADVADVLLDSMEAEGYRFWFNAKLAIEESDAEEIGKKMNSSGATVLILTDNSINDGLVRVAIDSTVDRRIPLVVYMTYESKDMLDYLHTLFDRSVNVTIIRIWEQSFTSSNSVRQALLPTKGLTTAQAAELYNCGMDILSSENASPEAMNEAMKSISYAASDEYPPALNFLGNLALERARAGNESYSSAVLYYRVASEKGDINSIYRLGCMIADGEGFAKNPSAALAYLAIAAVENIADAQFRVAEMMEYGTGIAQNRADATKWYMKALENGDRRAYLKLAERYLNGDTIVRNEYTAAEYYIEAAADKEPQAYLMLAKLYRDGVGIKRDAEKSEDYFRLAAEKGITEAQYNYGICLYLSKKYVEAFKWLVLSVSDLPEGAAPEPDALYHIAECYENGYGTSQDRTKAFIYYYDSAKYGHTKARLAVAECYRKGIGVPVNKRAAAFYDPKYSDDADPTDD